MCHLPEPAQRRSQVHGVQSGDDLEFNLLGSFIQCVRRGGILLLQLIRPSFRKIVKGGKLEC